MLKTSMLWILLVTVGVCLGQETGVKADANSAVQTEVQNLELELAKLVVKGEWAQYADFLTDDYARITTQGNIQTKQDVMNELREPARKVLDVLPEELQVRIFGDTAILTGHMTVLARQQGRVTTSFSRYTRVFVKRNNRWMLAAEQGTTVLK
jgi:ketosteroid isomerase-like protein